MPSNAEVFHAEIDGLAACGVKRGGRLAVISLGERVTCPECVTVTEGIAANPSKLETTLAASVLLAKIQRAAVTMPYSALLHMSKRLDSLEAIAAYLEALREVLTEQAKITTEREAELTRLRAFERMVGDAVANYTERPAKVKRGRK
jgi:hypothetical protein